MNPTPTRPTYEEWLLSLKTPFKVLWDNQEWIVTDNKDEYTLTPCFANQNDGKSIKLPLDTVFFNVDTLRYDL